MVIIPAGGIDIGSGSTLRRIAIPHPLAVSRFTVTGSQWQKSQLRPAVTSPAAAELPMVGVSHADARAYATYLRKETHKHYRLLRASEWEYCCRAMTATSYYFGDVISGAQANFNSKGVASVHTYPCNGWGLYQMHGNVWEWCDPDNQADRACLRGGSWGSRDVAELTSEYRLVPPIGRPFKNIYTGFRVAREI